MTDREKLAELLMEAETAAAERGFFNCFPNEKVAAFQANFLIANGVKVVGTETDLTGKCGSCAFSKPVRYCRSTSDVECTNEDLLKSRPNRGKVSAVRARTTKGCKRYTPMPKED